MKPPKYTQEAINNYRKSGYKINCPTTHSAFKNQVHVAPAGKPPKLRFKPGTFIELEGQLYEVLYCYLTKNSEGQWCFYLEERTSVDQPLTEMDQILEGMGCGRTTPRVVYEIFHDEGDVSSYFFDIPKRGDARSVSNKTMLKGNVVTP